MALNYFRRRRNLKRRDLDPDEIFLDAHNLPAFDTQQFEGRLERPIGKRSLYLTLIVFLLFGFIYWGQIFNLQVIRGEALAVRSENNSLRHTPIFPERGVIYDRVGRELAWNIPGRRYDTAPGLAHVIGFIGYPQREEIMASGYHPQELIGRAGLEKMYNQVLGGQIGLRIEEVDATGQVVSDYLLSPGKSGQSIVASIDSRIQSELYRLIEQLARERGFKGGAGVIIDVTTGEIIALTSYPEYDPNILVQGADRERINFYLNDPAGYFLNRAVSGLYTPGSVIKPFIAVAALEEKVVTPAKTFVSTGELVVPNRYNPSQPSIFKDWKAHGTVDLRRALAVSSNIYFYQVGGGFGNQRGVGISNINKYARLFGFGQPVGLSLAREEAGIVPSPEWKAANFGGEDWFLGDTYHTAIGQYGFLVTPLQMVRAAAAVATGRLITPTLLKTDEASQLVIRELGFNQNNLAVVREGMRQAVTEGTAIGLNVGSMAVAAKTGTAELGTLKEDVNSWVIGFWPYERPRYAFTVVMERGSRSNLVGGVSIMRQLLDWLAREAPAYLSSPAA